jgi:hypothetical protein
MRQARGEPVDVDSMRAALAHGALDLGDPGVDDSFGGGQVRLDRSPPALRLRLAPGERRLLRARASDRGTLRELRISLDGQALLTLRRPYARVRLPALAPGPHRVTVEAEDMAGNVAVKSRAFRGRGPA